MKSYELTFLISTDLAEEEAKQFQDKIISLIQTEGGILTTRSIILRKKLAYLIKKQIQAFLAILTFQIEPIKLINLEKKLKLESQILRYLILIKPPVKKMPARRKRVPEIVPKEPTISPLKKKVELKEIEKKLEEILKG